MTRPRPEPVQIVKERRDAALAALAGAVPYSAFLGTVKVQNDFEIYINLLVTSN